jgi:hypothetical protein
MTSKKLGALLQTVPPATARPASHVGPAASPAVAVKREPEVPLQVLIPARVREELGIMVAKEKGASLRSLVLRAVRGLGIEVTEEEIRGKRGRHRS